MKVYEFEILRDLNPVKGFEKVQQQNKAKNPASKHYELWNDYEAIDVMKKVLSKDEYVGFLKGNILKYQLRLAKKDDIQKEVQKIKDYQAELNSIHRALK